MGFELILPFLRPIEAQLLDDSVGEIMGNPDGSWWSERDGTLRREVDIFRRTRHSAEESRRTPIRLAMSKLAANPAALPHLSQCGMGLANSRLSAPGFGARTEPPLRSLVSLESGNLSEDFLLDSLGETGLLS